MIQPKNKISAASQLLEFLKKYWLFIVFLLVGFPYLKRYLDDQKEKTRLADEARKLEAKKQADKTAAETKLVNNTNPITQNKTRSLITSNKELHSVSSNLAHHFGVAYSDTGNWYDFLNPKGFTENDHEILQLLVTYRRYFVVIEKLYFEVDTNSRNLRKDIVKYLDPKDLKELRKYLKV